MNTFDLNKYFANNWKSNLDQYKYSGFNLINKILPNESVIDVGCGFNEFRGRIPNLIGIDPANAQADYRLSIEGFQSAEKFDVAFCLGSINFGDESTIVNQISAVIRLLKPNGRIYWRCNPGAADHGNSECKEIDFYPWTIAEHVRLSELFGFRLMTCRWDKNNRIYAEWSRSA
jgi:SAM-dependent methyltransferase